MTASTVQTASAAHTIPATAATTAALRQATQLAARTMQRSGLSSLGWAATATGLVCLIAGALLGWRELLAAGFTGFSMVACAAIMATRPPQLAATLDVQSTSVSMGGTIDIAARITAQRHHRPTATAHCTLRVGDDTHQLAIRSITPASPADLALTIPANRRAVVPVGPLTVTAGDPLGLARRGIMLATTTNVHVHPRILSPGPLPAGSAHDLEGQSGNARASSDIDLYELRDYMPGDDLRHVHWPSSAKTGSLLVRQYQATQHTAIHLLLDRNAHSYATPEEFELAVTLVASVGAQALREHRPLVTGGESRGARTHDTNAFLDRCSALQPISGAPDDLPIFHESDKSKQSKQSAGPDHPAGQDHPSEPAGDGDDALPATAALHLAVVGSQLPLKAIRRFAQSAPTGPVVILRSALGERAGIAWDAGYHLATAGAAKDLPILMEALR